MLEEHGDVIVVGAGLIGLAIAFELAQRGARVRVYERGEAAGAASWAAAGMLAPYTESLRDENLRALCVSSLAEYPAFVERVYAASGVDPKLRLDGIIHAAFDEPSFHRLEDRAHALRERGVACAVLDRRSLLAVQPWLASGVAGGLAIEGEGCIDNRRLGRALVAACEAIGAVLVRASSIAVECDGRRALGLRTDLGFVPARAIVNACGAWAGQLEGPPPACVPPIVPIKGQMLALAVPRDFVSRSTWVPGAYFVPRDDGRLLLGATVESAGFDERVTAEGIHQLLHAALAAAPSLSGFTVSESWAGLRPGTPDGLPFLGATPIEGLFLAAGHYRNGVLLAPASARLIADAIEGRAAPLEPFLLARLRTEEAHAGRMRTT